jgi:hypothetical protein
MLCCVCFSKKMADSGYSSSNTDGHTSYSSTTDNDLVPTGAEGFIYVLHMAERIFAKYATLFRALFPAGCRSRNELNFLRHIENYSEFFKNMELKAERLKEPLRELFKNTYILEGSDSLVKAFDRAVDNFNDLVYGSLKLLDIIHGEDMRNNFLTWRRQNLQKVECHLSLADKWTQKVTSKAKEMYYTISTYSLNHDNCHVMCQRTYRRQRPNARSRRV